MQDKIDRAKKVHAGLLAKGRRKDDPAVAAAPEAERAARELLQLLADCRPQPPRRKYTGPRLPKALRRAFIIPHSTGNPYGNPVARRGKRRFDPETGLPYEIWLKQPPVEFALAPAVEFMMGRYRVRLTRPFYIGKYEVTQGQWRAVMGSTPWAWFSRDDPRKPAMNVSWFDCQHFVTKLNSRIRSEVFALPTEAQWEYACRAGSTSAYCFGNDAGRLKDYAWYKENVVNCEGRVGLKKPNSWGVYDMHGNVWEWCLDGRAKYPISPQVDPRSPDEGFPSLRGGAWNREASMCRSAFRNRCRASDVWPFYGFRVLLEPPSPK